MRSVAAVLAVAVAALVGCHVGYTAIGFDVQTRTAGSMQTVVDPNGGTRGSIALGFGSRSIAMEIKANGHDLGLADHLLAASGGLELKVRLLHYGPVAAFVHGGPMRAARFDADKMAVTWGVGYAYGAGLQLGYMGAHVFADLHDESTWYGTPAGQTSGGGPGSVRAMTVGIILGM